VTTIKIVCKARSHQRRPQIIARFHDIGDGMWEEVSGNTRDGVRSEHISHLRLLDGDEPSDGGQHPANSGYRLRFRFECGMCGDGRLSGERTCSTSSTGYATPDPILTPM
jgi:hypothetical protein